MRFKVFIGYSRLDEASKKEYIKSIICHIILLVILNCAVLGIGNAFLSIFDAMTASRMPYLLRIMLKINHFWNVLYITIPLNLVFIYADSQALSYLLARRQRVATYWSLVITIVLALAIVFWLYATLYTIYQMQREFKQTLPVKVMRK